MSLKYKNLPLKSCAYKSFENMYGFICKSILFVALYALKRFSKIVSKQQ